MESQLKTFETYITSLTERGVFPLLERHSNGWTCILRNGINKQLMPISNQQVCWGETMLEAVLAAVKNLNNLFHDPLELHQYIDTGVSPEPEYLQVIKVA